MRKRNKHSPPSGFDLTTTACKPCPPCPPEPPCEEICGIFNFEGPAKVYSFNTHHQFNVFFIVGDERHLICTFGHEDSKGCSPLVKEHDYDLCGNYEIEWCVCEDGEQPIFHTSVINPTHTLEGCCVNNGYHDDAFGDDADSVLVGIGGGLFSWTPGFKPFNSFVIDTPSNCKISFATDVTESPIRLIGSKIYASGEFNCDLTYITLTGTELCLRKTHVIVKKS